MNQGTQDRAAEAGWRLVCQSGLDSNTQQDFVALLLLAQTQNEAELSADERAVVSDFRSRSGVDANSSAEEQQGRMQAYLRSNPIPQHFLRSWKELMREHDEPDPEQTATLARNLLSSKERNLKPVSTTRGANSVFALYMQSKGG